MKFAKRRCVDVNLDELDRVLDGAGSAAERDRLRQTQGRAYADGDAGHLRHTQRAEGAEVTGTDRGGRRHWRPLFTREAVAMRRVWAGVYGARAGRRRLVRRGGYGDDRETPVRPARQSGTSRRRAVGPHAGGNGSLLLLRSYQWRINAWREVLAMIAAFVTSVTLQAISIQTSQWILRG